MNQSLQVETFKLQSKSMLISLLLTFFFGGLGIFYVSTLGGVICTVIEVALWIASFLTFGLGFIAVAIWHFFCFFFAAIKTNSHNKKLIRSVQTATA